jgi:hypothetical protein
MMGSMKENLLAALKSHQSKLNSHIPGMIQTVQQNKELLVSVYEEIHGPRPNIHQVGKYFRFGVHYFLVTCQADHVSMEGGSRETKGGGTRKFNYIYHLQWRYMGFCNCVEKKDIYLICHRKTVVSYGAMSFYSTQAPVVADVEGIKA